ncbi:MAG: hypothetical protein ACTSX6_10495 [Candidatus Heimdallarchaeaceae archaeon]
MELKSIIMILLGLFCVFLVILAMGNPGIAFESADWTTVSRNVSYFIIYLAVITFLIWVFREVRK